MKDIRPSADAPERSIRNIHLGRRHHKASEVAEDDAPLMRRRPRRSRRLLWGVVVVLVAVLGGVLLSTVFAGASVRVYPRVETVMLPATLQAQLNAPVGVLAYQNLSIDRSASQTVPATGVSRVSRPASGLVTINNSYSSASQRLIANTRFAAPNGKIYRIRDSVVVPGMSQGKPGSATATLYADSPGPVYNKSGQVTFTIPGFKGDPRYTKFSAVSQGDITGGFIGDEPTVAPADLVAAKAALQKQLDQDIRAGAASGIPEGFVAIPGTLKVTFGTMTQTPGSNNTATLTQSATAQGVMVRIGDFASAIARKSVQGYQGEAVLFGDTSNMNASAATSSTQNGVVIINLSGQAQLVWQFDAQAVKQALVGKDKSQFETTIKGFEPSIGRAEASIRPFWQGKFPTDPGKISVTVNPSK